MLNRMAPRERNSISWPISYPCRARSSSNARIINSALPFFNSRSGTGDDIYGNAIYAEPNGVSTPSRRGSGRQSGNQESRKTHEGRSERRATTPSGAAFPACRGLLALLYSLLFVCDRGARWAGKMDDLEQIGR